MHARFHIKNLPIQHIQVSKVATLSLPYMQLLCLRNICANANIPRLSKPQQLVLYVRHASFHKNAEWHTGTGCRSCAFREVRHVRHVLQLTLCRAERT